MDKTDRIYKEVNFKLLDDDLGKGLVFIECSTSSVTVRLAMIDFLWQDEAMEDIYILCR